MRKADKAKPSRNQMVVAFRSYLKKERVTAAAWHQVVMSPDGLAWEGKYSEWYNGNGHRNMNKIYGEWTKKRSPKDYYFAKDSRGLYYPTQGDGKRKHYTPRWMKSGVDADKTVENESSVTQLKPQLDNQQPARSANVNGVLIIPVTSANRFQNILDMLKGVLDDSDHDFLTDLLATLFDKRQ